MSNVYSTDPYPRAEYLDMTHDTDCPYPIRIWAFLEMIRPYQTLIRIGGKLWNIFVFVIFGCVAKDGQFCRRCNVILSLNFDRNVADLRHHIGN